MLFKRLTQTVVAALTAVLFIAAPAKADGLVFKLPEDKAWIAYKMEMTTDEGGQEMSRPGTLTLRSVGKAFESGEDCRWIEFKMVQGGEGQERTVIAKVLVPEKHLKKGESPFDQRVRGWIKQGDAAAQTLDGANDHGPLPAFLAGPLDDAKPLDKETLEVAKLGKLECEGVTGKHTFKQREEEITYTATTRLNDKAPFGVVSSRYEFEIKRDGQSRKGRLTLEVADVGGEAETELPGQE